MGSKAILVIDSHPFWQDVKSRAQKSFQVEILQETDGRGLEDLLARQFFLTVFLTETLPDASFDQTLGAIKQKCPLLPIFVVSSRPTVEGAITAMRAGAQAYLALLLSLEKLREVLLPCLALEQDRWLSQRSKTAENGRSRPMMCGGWETVYIAPCPSTISESSISRFSGPC